MLSIMKMKDNGMMIVAQMDYSKYNLNTKHLRSIATVRIGGYN